MVPNPEVSPHLVDDRYRFDHALHATQIILTF